MTLQHLIMQYVRLGKPTSKGWLPCVHTGCDHGNKGMRAAFIFNDSATTFNCFNCSASVTYNPEFDTSMSDNMEKILNDFNIPKEEWQKVVFDNFIRVNQHGALSLKRVERNAIEPEILPLPPYFYILEDDPNNTIAQKAIAYLNEQRSIDYLSYPFLLGKLTNDPKSIKWKDRLIIPIFKNDNIIFYQGRDLTGTAIKKYESPDAARENVIHGFEHLFTNPDLPLYITEGWFDAYHINGVAVLGAKMSESQVKWLNQSPRTKVIVPDKSGDGDVLARQAIALGWSVAIPDCGQTVKDVNDCIVKYGPVYTLQTLKAHTFCGYEAEMRVNMYCESTNKRASKSNNNNSSTKI